MAGNVGWIIFDTPAARGQGRARSDNCTRRFREFVWGEKVFLSPSVHVERPAFEAYVATDVNPFGFNVMQTVITVQ